MASSAFAEQADILASVVGTPLCLIDLAAVRRKLDEFREALPAAWVFYSTKTNPDPAIVDLMAAAGVGFDAATIHEVEYLTQERGVEADRLLYTHPVKSAEDIRRANALGVRRFTVDSTAECQKVAANASDACVLVRIDVGQSGVYDYAGRLGATLDVAEEILGNSGGRCVDGVSFHVGSQSTDPAAWRRAIELVAPLLDRHPQLTTINVGAGFPVEYGEGPVPTISEIGETLHAALRTWVRRPTTFMAEPGRVLVGAAGAMIVSVVDVVPRTSGRWAFTDASVYNGPIELLESAGRLTYPVRALTRRGRMGRFNVAGATLDPDDILAEDVDLPADLRAGDRLVLDRAGAYTRTLFSSYHHLPPPAVGYLDSAWDERVGLVGSAIDRYGVGAVRDVDEGETAFVVSGARVQERTRTSWEAGDGWHVEPSVWGRFINHSCEPNCLVRTRDDGRLETVARRPIAKSEELTVDYATFESEVGSAGLAPCRCGSADCRSRITGYDDLSRQSRTSLVGLAAHLL